jgi:dynactin 1
METAVSVGSRVSTANGTGVVRFAGTTAFQAGKWIGVELDSPTGKNNGTVQGKAYFSCRDGHGVFVRPAGIKIIDVSPRKSLDEQTRGVSKVLSFQDCC